MNKLQVLLPLLFLIAFSSYAQKGKLTPFRIEGSINADSGKLTLFFNSDYNLAEQKILISDVKERKFSFSGYIPESQSVFVILDDVYRSGEFIIDPGKQEISINIDSVDYVPFVSNKTMRKEYPDFSAFFQQINTEKERYYRKEDSIRRAFNNQLPQDLQLNLQQEYNCLINKGDSLLLQYSKQNPDSKIAFWKLIHIMGWGYIPIIESIYNNFSDELKKGYAGSVLKQKIDSGKQIAVGTLFPSISISDMEDSPFSTKVFRENKLTLVEFWYSRCGPCRALFPSMRNLHKKFNSKGFEIIGISVDENEDSKLWRNIISQESLSWPQYIDTSKVVKKDLAIITFPSNFLIDNTGKIIAKNLSMEELEKYLNENL